MSPPRLFEKAQVAASVIGLGVGEAGARRPAHGQLHLAVAVEVAGSSGREHAIGAEEGPALEDGPVRCVEGIGLLVQRACEDVRPGLQAGDRERRLDAVGGLRVAGGVLHSRGPELRAVRAVRLVAANPRVLGVAGAEEDRVKLAPAQGGHGGGGVDGRAPSQTGHPCTAEPFERW